MGLVHEDTVHTELLKFDVVLILGGVGQLVDLGLKLLALLFKILDGKALAALLSLGLLDGPDDAVNLLLVQVPCKVGGDRQLLELLIADDNCVILAVGNAVGENLAVGSGKITCFRHKQLRRWEEVHELIAPLCNQRLGHSEQRLLNQTQFLELHGRRCHLVCFAGADLMCQQGIAARGDDPLHRIPLVRSQGLHGIGAVDRQVVAVVLRGHDGVEGLVVERSQLSSAALVLPQPLLELLLDSFDLFVGRCGGILVHHALAVVGLVLHHHALAVEHGVEQIQEAPAAGAPLLRVGCIVFQVFCTQLHGEVAGIRISGHRNILAIVRIISAQNMNGEVRVHTVRNPRRTGIHEDILVAHILRHYRFQCFHIPLVVLVHGHHGLCVPQLCTDIAGEVDLCRLQTTVAVLEHLPAVQQLSGHILHGLAGEPCDQSRIHAAGLVHRYDQTLSHILCRGDGAIRCNGVLGEDIRLGCLLGLGVVVFQCEDGELVRIVLDGVAVGLGVEEAVLLHESVVCLVQGRSGLSDLGFFQTLLLGSLQCLGGIPDLQHTGNALGGALGGLHLYHLAILVLVHLSVLDGQAVILGLLSSPLHSKIGFLRACLRRIVHLSLNGLECRPNLVRKAALTLQCLVGQAAAPVHAALEGCSTQNHFRVVVEIIVDVCNVPIPCNRSGGRCFQEVLTGIIGVGCSLFQDQNIRHDLSASVALERSIRKSDCAQQVGPLHDVTTYRGIAAVHGIAGGNEHHDAAGSHLVQRLGKEVVVDGTGHLLGIVLIRNGVVSERNIANCHIHEVVGDVGLLKALDAHICIGIQVLGDQTGDAVQLHHRPATHLFAHVRRHSTHEVAHAGRRLHHSAAGKAQMLQTVIHGLDDGYFGVMGVQGGTSCAAVFLLGQQFLQLCILLGPVCFSLVEGISQAAPAHILGKDDLLRLGSIAALNFQFLHQANSFHIGLVSGLFAVGQIQAVTDHKVTALGLLGGLPGDLLHNILMELFRRRRLCLFRPGLLRLLLGSRGNFLHALSRFRRLGIDDRLHLLGEALEFGGLMILDGLLVPEFHAKHKAGGSTVHINRLDGVSIGKLHHVQQRAIQIGEQTLVEVHILAIDVKNVDSCFPVLGLHRGFGDQVANIIQGTIHRRVVHFLSAVLGLCVFHIAISCGKKHMPIRNVLIIVVGKIRNTHGTRHELFQQLIHGDFLRYLDFQAIQHLRHIAGGVLDLELAIIGHGYLDCLSVGIHTINQGLDQVFTLNGIEAGNTAGEGDALHRKLLALNALQECLHVGSLNGHPYSLAKLRLCLLSLGLGRDCLVSGGSFLGYFLRRSGFFGSYVIISS